ncbi:hypothetical protein [Shimia thalassica]|uniref:hypothetical protein n=1 Tax=Shimia thalassica TaxID=1715693 RepID=UPI0026E315DE|nr:hypothetical protein [Shimia thalassica]MDO6799399.1 hypothetical protein [Shimia thalassica]
MTHWLIFTLWLGGMPAAYRKHRRHENNRLWSAVCAGGWPLGIGYRIARDFYTDPDFES